MTVSCFFSLAAAHGQTEKADEPAELSIRREIYKQKVVGATKPLKLNYITQLDRLQKKYTLQKYDFGDKLKEQLASFREWFTRKVNANRQGVPLSRATLDKRGFCFLLLFFFFYLSSFCY